MKRFLIASIAALSLNAFAQSYIIMDNGVTITTDKSGFAYDFGHYAFPQKITLKGGQYFVEEDRILATIDENGFLYRKYEVIPEKIIGRGMNYFLSAKGDLFTIDRTGLVTTTKDEAFKNAGHFGGNYFVVTSPEGQSDIITINRDGKHIPAGLEKFELGSIVAFGGTYFMNNRGVVTTVSGDGILTPRPEVRVGLLVKKGGNYFTDSSNLLFTVTEDGKLINPGLPLNLKVTNITKLGSNYFFDISGRLYVVDQNGQVFERNLNGIDFRTARVISL